MYYRLKNKNELLDWAEYKYDDKCLETKIITQKEYNTNPDKIIIQNGIIELNPEYEKIELNRAKENKIKENDGLRDKSLNQGIEYKGVLFDSDTDQKVNLLAIVSTMQDTGIITWFGKDNQPLKCNKEDLINIGGLITELHTFCWNKNAEIKALINEAETVEEVNKIAIDYTISLDNIIQESENLGLYESEG